MYGFNDMLHREQLVRLAEAVIQLQFARGSETTFVLALTQPDDQATQPLRKIM